MRREIAYRSSGPARVLYVSSTSDLYGGSRALLGLVKHLNRRAYDPVVLVPCDGPLVPLLREAGAETRIEPGIEVIRRRVLTGSRLPRFLAGALPAFGRVLGHIRHTRAELVHTNTAVIFTPAIAARLCRVPHVWHVRETFVEWPRLWAGFARVISALSTRVFCISNDVRNQFGPLLASRGGDIELVSDGIDWEEFRAQPADPAALRARFGICAEDKLIACVGRISSWKGQDVLVRAMALLKEKSPQWKLLIVGDAFPGNEHCVERVRQMTRELGIVDRVIFTGFVNDVPSVLKAASVFVLPSTNPEPFGGVMLEAMAMGVPVVATAGGGPMDVIRHGVSGLLVPAKDEQALAAAMAELMEDPRLRQKLAEGGFLRAQDFSLTRTAETVQRAYAQVLGHPLRMPAETAAA